MVTVNCELDAATAIRRVNETLQGSVAELLCHFVPELKRLPAGQIYQRTLDDLGLLQRCFAAFRDQRDAFRPVLLDADKRPVEDDRTVLSCGRTLEQVVAMVVRTAAKRYFRRKLDWGISAHRPMATARLRGDVQHKGFAHRITSIFQDHPTQSSTHMAEPPRSRADELYDAIKEHLLHEWQVPLVPAYAGMTPKLVRALGDKLLELRTPHAVQTVAEDPAEAARLFDIPGAAQPQAAAQTGRQDERVRLPDILTPDGKRLRTEAFTATLLRPELRAQLGLTGQSLRITEALREVGGLPAKLLVAELGLRLDQLAVILLVAHDSAGNDLFIRIFGQPGNAEVIMRLTQNARLAGLSQHSPLEDCAAFIRQIFTRLGPTER